MKTAQQLGFMDFVAVPVFSSCMTIRSANFDEGVRGAYHETTLPGDPCER